MNFPFHQDQLRWMTELTDSRVAFLNPIFSFLNYFDSPYFFFVLITVTWVGFSYQWGLRIYYWLTFNNLVNSFAKMLFAWPRPSTDNADLGMFHPTSYGFPSGGAQGCMFLGVLLLYYWKTPDRLKKWAIALSYILLISFSRLYLGVHYPLDILGGWVIALFLAALCIKTKEPIEKFLHKQNLWTCLLLSQLLPLSILFLSPRVSYVVGSIMGIGLGACISLKYRLFLSSPKGVNEGVARAVFGLTTLFLLYFLWPIPKETFTKSFILSLFMSVAASPAYKYFFLKEK
jgi:membrane-associated phospholipid phosphatase